MPAPTRRTPGSDTEDYTPSMADYQRAINQSIHWPHYNEDRALEPVPIDSLHPARATNALHKLRRWQHALFDGATEQLYEQARATLMASPLAAALIEQALGEYYSGTYLQTSTAAPHVDELAARREDVQLEVGAKARMKEALMLIAIDALDENLGTSDRTFAQRCLALRDRLFDYLTGKD